MHGMPCHEPPGLLPRLGVRAGHHLLLEALGRVKGAVRPRHGGRATTLASSRFWSCVSVVSQRRFSGLSRRPCPCAGPTRPLASTALSPTPPRASERS